MPTDNPKISLYVPQQIFDRFKEFQEERKLSMSQAGIVIIAEYFGIEETIKEITEGTTVGGVTLTEFEALKKRIDQLEKLANVNKKVAQKETTSGSQNIQAPESNISAEDGDSPLSIDKQARSEPQLELLSNPIAIKPIPATHLCTKRFGLGKDSLASYKRKHTVEELIAWTKEKDPDRIAWVISIDGKGYIPKGELPNELLSKLQNWIADNT